MPFISLSAAWRQKLLFAFALLVLPLLAKSQNTKEVKRGTPGHDVKERYSVLKSDKDMKQGAYKMLYRNQEITNGHYNQGQRTGTWTFKDTDAKVYFDGHYTNGLKDSVWTYIKDYALTAQLYFTKGVIDSVFGFYPDGKYAYVQRMDANGNGHVYSFYPNGIVKQSIPIHGNVMDGICVMGFENGRLYRRFEVRNNEIETVLETFDPDGRPIDGGTLKDGTGTYLRYFPDSMAGDQFNFGILATYQNGILAGPYRSYNSDGELVFTGQCVDGQKDGYWRRYNKTGLIDSVLFQPNSHLISRPDSVDRSRRVGYFVPELMSQPGTLPSFQNGMEGMHNFIMLNRLFPVFLFEQRPDDLGKALHLARRIPVVCWIDIDGSFSKVELLEDVHENPWPNRTADEGIWMVDPIDIDNILWKRYKENLWLRNIIFGEMADKSPEHTRYNDESLRLANTMPRWTPAFRDHIPIAYPVGIVF